MKISTCYQSFFLFLLAYSAHQSSLSPSCGTLKVNLLSLSPTDLALIELQCSRSSEKSPSELLISSTHSLNTQFFTFSIRYKRLHFPIFGFIKSWLQMKSELENENKTDIIWTTFDRDSRSHPKPICFRSEARVAPLVPIMHFWRSSGFCRECSELLDRPRTAGLLGDNVTQDGCPVRAEAIELTALSRLCWTQGIPNKEWALQFKSQCSGK